MSSHLMTITEFSLQRFLEMMSWKVPSHTMIVNDQAYFFYLQASERLKIFSKNLMCVICGLEGNCFKLKMQTNAKPRKNIVLSTCYVKNCLWYYPREYCLFQPHINMYHRNNKEEI